MCLDKQPVSASLGTLKEPGDYDTAGNLLFLAVLSLPYDICMF